MGKQDFEHKKWRLPPAQQCFHLPYLKQLSRPQE